MVKVSLDIQRDDKVIVLRQARKEGGQDWRDPVHFESALAELCEHNPEPGAWASRCMYLLEIDGERVIYELINTEQGQSEPDMFNLCVATPANMGPGKRYHKLGEAWLARQAGGRIPLTDILAFFEMDGEPEA